MSATGTSRVITEALEGSPLALAVQARRLPPELQPWCPGHRAEWIEHVEQARRGVRRDWLEAIRPALADTGAATGAAGRRLERAAAEGGVVVTTGQQPGLFGGPLYTLAKALTALELADEVERQLGVPAAPVFWAATDDADFPEASVAHVADADGLHELKLTRVPPAGTMMANTPLGDTRRLLEDLRRSCGSAADPGALELARAAFSGERSLGDSYVSLMRGLLEPLGVAVMDASHEAVRRAARPLLVEALERAPEISRAAAERSAAIQGAGFAPQVGDDRGLSLVFSVEHGRKRRIELRKAAVAARGAGALAPNVLLRPIVERELFPTVAYAAGPGELAYFTQSNAVAAALDRPPVVGVPRWSGTVVEPFVDRALRRLGVDWHELRDLHAVERRLASAALPPRVAASWKRLLEHVHASVRELADAVNESALLPPPVIEGLERSLAHRLARGERRLLAAAKRRDVRVRADLAVASAALFPLGSRQERVLNFLPMLTRGGEELLGALRTAAKEHATTLLAVERAVPVATR